MDIELEESGRATTLADVDQWKGSLPQIFHIKQGYCGQLAQQTIEDDQLLICYQKISLPVAKATYRDSTISIPLQSPTEFAVVGKKGVKEYYARMTDLMEADPLPECVATVTATLDAYNQKLESGSILFVHEVAQKKKKSFLKSKVSCPRVLEFRTPSGNIVRLSDTCTAGFSTKAADLKVPIHQICNGVRQLPVEIQCFSLPRERKLDPTKKFMLLEVCENTGVVVGISRSIYETGPAMTLPLDFPLTLVPVRARDPVRNKQIQANLEETVHSEKFQTAQFGVVTSDISINCHIQQAFYESVPTSKFERPSVARAYEIPTPWKLQVGDLKEEDSEKDLKPDPHYDYVDLTKPRIIIIPGSRSKEMTIFSPAASTNKSLTKQTSSETEEAYVDTTTEAGETESERSEDDTTSKSLQLPSEEPSSKDCLQQDKGNEIDPYIQMVKGSKRTPKSLPPPYSASKSKLNSTDMKDRASTRVATSTPTVKARNQPESPVTTLEPTSTDTSKPTPPSTTLKATSWSPTLKSPPPDTTLMSPSSDETPTPCPPIRRVKQTLAKTKQHNPPVKATKPTNDPSPPATSSKPSISDPGQQGTTSRDTRTAIDTPKPAVKAGAPTFEPKPSVAPRGRTCSITSKLSPKDTTSEQTNIDTPKRTEKASASTPPVAPRETSTANGKPSPPVAPTEQDATATSEPSPPDITTLRNLKPKPLATSSRTSKEDTSQKGEISKDTPKQANEGSVPTLPVVPRKKTFTTTNKRSSQDTTTEEINTDTPTPTDETSSLSFKPNPPIAPREQNTTATSKPNHPDTTNTRQISKPSPPATSSKPSIPDPGQQGTTSRDTRTAIDTPKPAVKAGAPTPEPTPPVAPRGRTSTTTNKPSPKDTTSEQTNVDIPKPTEKASVSTPPVETPAANGKSSPPVAPTKQDSTATSEPSPPDITTLRNLKPKPPATSSRTSKEDTSQKGEISKDTPKPAVKASAPTPEPTPPVAPRERTSTTTDKPSPKDTTSEQTNVDTPKPTEKASTSTSPVAPQETSTANGKPSPQETTREQSTAATSRGSPTDTTSKRVFKPSTPTKGIRTIASIFESSLQDIPLPQTQTDTDETNRGDSTSTPTSPPITPRQPTMPASKSTSTPKPQSVTAIKSSLSKIELDSESEPSDEDQYVDVNVGYVESTVSTPSSKTGTINRNTSAVTDTWQNKVAPKTATPTGNTDHIYEDDGIYSEVQYGESEELFYQFPENPPELPMRGQQFPQSSGLSTMEKSTRSKNMKLLGQIKSITSDAVKSFKKEMQAEKQHFLDAINAKQDRPEPPPSTDQSPAVPVMESKMHRTARPSTVTVGKKSSHPKQVAAITYTVPIHVKKKSSRHTASLKRMESQREPSPTDPTVKKQPPPRPPPASTEVINKRALNGLDNEGVLALLAAMNLTEFQPSFKQEQVDGALLASMGDEELEELGITKSIQRMRLMQVITGKKSIKEFLGNSHS